nr:MAG TPA: hypothetical protein [Caudoviricetes sp.]
MERLLGSKYHISLGTAMVFESPEFDIRKWPNLMYVNLRTLYRNYVHSYPKEMYSSLNTKTFIQMYLDEVSEFERLVKEVSNGRVTTYFYYPRYEQIDRKLPHIEFKEYNPESFDVVELNMWEYVKRQGLVTPFNYDELKGDLPPAREPVLLLSSFIVDLLSAPNFPMLLLIESFTGKIKKRQEWYTKINFGKGKSAEGVYYPFNKFTMQIFGDKSGALKSAPRELRMLVRSMAKQDRWSPMTTNDRIRYSISKIKDFNLKQLLLSYL